MSENNSQVQLPDFVLVHPQLKDDPVAKQGQIGVITAAILNSDEFYVGFDDKEVGLYAADALLLFNPSDQIYQNLKQDVMKLAPSTFKDLKNIALLLDYGTTKQQRTAMEIAQRNPDVIASAMVSLEETLGLDQSYKRGR
ncbi:hypothetical protein ABIB62_004262 [Mucilaginibacter sp. UYP25]|uniref:hypothetical protein n=1 Tax=unclassified Mucilaginibacter TaxID=2617802 RepID=UPI003391F792